MIKAVTLFRHRRLVVPAIWCINVLCMQSCKTAETALAKPNIIIFYVDDLGYGDLGSYGATLTKTPYVDGLAKDGIRFTDGHSTAATCTPSRYSLLTGEYAFRNAAAILPGDAPLLIPTTKPTLPRMLSKAGYTTGVVGKWHLGLGNGQVNWNDSIAPGPLEIGFNYSFLLPATGDRVPTVFVENHHVVNADPNDPIEISYSQKLNGYPNGLDSPQMLRQTADTQHSNTIVNGISRIGYMKGGKKALWRDEEFPVLFSQKANEFVSRNREKPFFLFFSFHDIHVPRVPNEQFAGKSPLGPRGDAIMQMDWTVQQVMEHLRTLDLLDNTLVIFTSDNGPVLDDGYGDSAVLKLGDHKPWGEFRGGKYSAFEAGTRVPFFVSWPARIKSQTSSALVSQVDLYRSLAAIAGVQLSADEAIDSEDLTTTLLGEGGNGRAKMLEESFTLSVRDGNWKYIAPMSPEKKVPPFMANKKIESGASNKAYLFNLDNDKGEKINLAESMPDRVEAMQAYLDMVKAKKTAASQ